MFKIGAFLPRSARQAALAAGALCLAACAAAPADPDALIADPYENTNRSVHSFNKGVDEVVLRPVAQAYDFATPALVKLLLSNGLDHLRLPGIFVNRVLQGDVDAAGEVLGRFTLNTLLGAGGLLDPATEFGLPQEPTDFGVTLAVWGAEEGVYLEAPLLGPNTTRSLAGRVVDFALDPGFLITVGVIEVGTTIQILDAARTPTAVVNARHENFELIDDIFYESEDSYVAARSGYVQRRRRQVSGETTEEDLPDIFE